MVLTLKVNTIGSESSKNLIVHWYSACGSPFILLFRNNDILGVRAAGSHLVYIYNYSIRVINRCKMEAQFVT